MAAVSLEFVYYPSATLTASAVLLPDGYASPIAATGVAVANAGTPTVYRAAFADLAVGSTYRLTVLQSGALAASEVYKIAAAGINRAITEIIPIEAGGAGDGPNSVTLTIQNSDDDSPIENASVSVTLAGTKYSGTTDVNGDVAFSLDSGTWTVAVTATGFDSLTPATLVVSGTTTQTYQLDPFAAGSVSAPFVAGLIRAVSQDAAAEEGVILDVVMTEAPSASTGLVIEQVQTVTTDASGYATVAILPGASYRVKHGTRTIQRFAAPTNAADGYQPPTCVLIP